MPHDKPIVFVVDDDASVRESLSFLIDAAGWQPETFGSAREFLSRPQVFVPCCLILDVNLPDLSGLDLQALIADRIAMPIIFITGYGDVPTTVRAMKAGAVEFLTKPLVDEVLIAAIRSAIDRSRVELRARSAVARAAGRLRVAQLSRARSDGARHRGQPEQAGRQPAWNQRNHRESPPRQADAKDACGFPPRPGEDGRHALPHLPLDV